MTPLATLFIFATLGLGFAVPGLMFTQPLEFQKWGVEKDEWP